MSFRWIMAIVVSVTFVDVAVSYSSQVPISGFTYMVILGLALFFIALAREG